MKEKSYREEQMGKYGLRKDYLGTTGNKKGRRKMGKKVI